MTSLLATRRRAEDFARLVDGSRSTHDPTLGPLLSLVDRLRQPADVDPSPAFRAELRERLIATAAELPADLTPRPVRFSHHSMLGPAPRTRVLAFVTVLALIGSVVSIAVMARRALPGDALYSVKRGLEGTQAAMSTNPESRGRQLLASGEARLDEVTDLVQKEPIKPTEKKKIALVQSTLKEFTTQSRSGGDLLIQAYNSGKQRAPLVKLREFTSSSSGRLVAIAPSLPAALQATLNDAAGALFDLESRAGGLCPTCVPNSSQPESSTYPDQSVSPSPTSTEGDQRRPGPSSPPTQGPLPGPTGGPPTQDPLPTSNPNPLPSLPLPLPTGLPLPTAIPLPSLPLPTLLPLPTSIPLPLPGSVPLLN